MTIDTSTLTNGSGLAAAQARMAQIQSMFAANATPAAGPTATTASFGDSMTRAQTSAGQASTERTGSGPTAGIVDKLHSALTQTKKTVASTTTSSASSTATTTSSLGLKDADAVLATAKKYLGIPYKWGGTNPNVGLDCSGFVQLVMKQHGITLPRVSKDQARQGTRVDSIKDARPGDLVAFGSPVHHIGIYVGDGKMIHAPRTGDVVKISKVHKHLTAIRRVLPDQPEAAPITSAPVSTKSPNNSTATTTTSALPAAGVNTAKLASTLRTAALSGGVDPTTWQEAIATAVKDSLAGSDVENAQAVMQSALAGLGTTGSGATAALLDASARAVTASNAATSRAATSLAPDALGARALEQAPAAYRELFVAAERKYGVPATLLAAVAKQESNFKARAVSHAGAQGLMQLMPGTARGLGVKNSFDPAQAVDGAARLLRSHLRTFGNTELALAAYNAGAGAVRKYDGIPPYRETQNYVRRIMAGLKGAAA